MGTMFSTLRNVLKALFSRPPPRGSTWQDQDEKRSSSRSTKDLGAHESSAASAWNPAPAQRAPQLTEIIIEPPPDDTPSLEEPLLPPKSPEKVPVQPSISSISPFNFPFPGYKSTIAQDEIVRTDSPRISAHSSPSRAPPSTSSLVSHRTIAPASRPITIPTSLAAADTEEIQPFLPVTYPTFHLPITALEPPIISPLVRASEVSSPPPSPPPLSPGTSTDSSASETGVPPQPAPVTAPTLTPEELANLDYCKRCFITECILKTGFLAQQTRVLEHNPQKRSALCGKVIMIPIIPQAMHPIRIIEDAVLQQGSLYLKVSGIGELIDAKEEGLISDVNPFKDNAAEIYKSHALDFVRQNAAVLQHCRTVRNTRFRRNVVYLRERQQQVPVTNPECSRQRRTQRRASLGQAVLDNVDEPASSSTAAPTPARKVILTKNQSSSNANDAPEQQENAPEDSPKAAEVLGPAHIVPPLPEALPQPALPPQQYFSQEYGYPLPPPLPYSHMYAPPGYPQPYYGQYMPYHPAQNFFYGQAPGSQMVLFPGMPQDSGILDRESNDPLLALLPEDLLESDSPIPSLFGRVGDVQPPSADRLPVPPSPLVRRAMHMHPSPPLHISRDIPWSPSEESFFAEISPNQELADLCVDNLRRVFITRSEMRKIYMHAEVLLKMSESDSTIMQPDPYLYSGGLPSPCLEISGLKPTVNVAAIYQVLGSYGEIAGDIIYIPNTNRSEVTFRRQVDARKARIALNGTKMRQLSGLKSLEVSYITPKRYVRLENLTEDPSEETIRSKYAKYGNIKCVELVADCKCAVLEFEDTDAATLAVAETHGAPMEGLTWGGVRLRAVFQDAPPQHTPQRPDEISILSGALVRVLCGSKYSLHFIENAEIRYGELVLQLEGAPVLVPATQISGGDPFSVTPIGDWSSTPCEVIELQERLERSGGWRPTRGDLGFTASLLSGVKQWAESEKEKGEESPLHFMLARQPVSEEQCTQAIEALLDTIHDEAKRRELQERMHGRAEKCAREESHTLARRQRRLIFAIGGQGLRKSLSPDQNAAARGETPVDPIKTAMPDKLDTWGEIYFRRARADLEADSGVREMTPDHAGNCRRNGEHLAQSWPSSHRLI